MTIAAELARSKQVSLTTFKKDGTPVATPIWQVTEGAEMYLVSQAEAWKVKRIRRDGRVTVTACDIRGKVEPGAPTAEGTATLLDGPGTEKARALLARRYITSRLGNWFSTVLRLPRKPLIGIVIRF
ncbi:PPOX class F420-dependent oxidoreductase [Actinoplanes sp. NPDC051494]|uniref:PPOX class F420-dependent oxidoreductase n=1 Tax=Actinoplanes sp. NPDC051494 TaxID=3363907 RepID=UPI003790BC41